MKSLLATFLLSFVATGAAFACENGKCDEKNCKMSHAPATAAAAAALPADGTHVTLAVSGMSCGACADKVRTALLAVPGVKGATVDAATGATAVSYDKAATTTDKLLAAVASSGPFTATIPTP